MPRIRKRTDRKKRIDSKYPGDGNYHSKDYERKKQLEPNFLYRSFLPGNKRDIPRLNRILLSKGIRAELATKHKDGSPVFGYVYRVRVEEAYKLNAHEKWLETDCPWGMPDVYHGEETSWQMSFKCHHRNLVWKTVSLRRSR